MQQLQQKRSSGTAEIIYLLNPLFHRELVNGTAEL